MRISQKEAELRELVITGLTHLVSSNSESGFKQCLHLAYDPDPRKRTIFAHVFARVIGEGTSFDIPEKPPSVNRRARFADVSFRHSFWSTLR
jgi:neurofibromin 1